MGDLEELKVIIKKEEYIEAAMLTKNRLRSLL